MENEDGSQYEHAMLISKYVRPDRGGILRRDDARNLLRRTLEYHVGSGTLRLYAWAFLPSKVALVVAMPTPTPLGDTLTNVFGYFTRRLNNRYRHRGAVFRTRFVKSLCTGPDEIAQAIARVHRMPHEREIIVRAGSESLSSENVYRLGVEDAITSRYITRTTSLSIDVIAV